MNLETTRLLDPQRLLIGGALLFLSAFAGIADHARVVDRETRNFFYVSNPEGLGGDYAGWQATRWACASDRILAAECTSREAIQRTLAAELEATLLRVPSARE
jgi:hypothetical protein